MSGNVSEWSTDSTSLSGDLMRVIRGGSWLDYEYEVQAIYRRAEELLISNNDVGFRVCALLG